MVDHRPLLEDEEQEVPKASSRSYVKWFLGFTMVALVYVTLAMLPNEQAFNEQNLMVQEGLRDDIDLTAEGLIGDPEPAACSTGKKAGKTFVLYPEKFGWDFPAKDLAPGDQTLTFPDASVVKSMFDTIAIIGNAAKFQDPKTNGAERGAQGTWAALEEQWSKHPVVKKFLADTGLQLEKYWSTGFEDGYGWHQLEKHFPKGDQILTFEEAKKHIGASIMVNTPGCTNGTPQFGVTADWVCKGFPRSGAIIESVHADGTVKLRHYKITEEDKDKDGKREGKSIFEPIQNVAKAEVSTIFTSLDVRLLNGKQEKEWAIDGLVFDNELGSDNKGLARAIIVAFNQLKASNPCLKLNWTQHPWPSKNYAPLDDPSKVNGARQWKDATPVGKTQWSHNLGQVYTWNPNACGATWLFDTSKPGTYRSNIFEVLKKVYNGQFYGNGNCVEASGPQWTTESFRPVSLLCGSGNCQQYKNGKCYDQRMNSAYITEFLKKLKALDEKEFPWRNVGVWYGYNAYLEGACGEPKFCKEFYDTVSKTEGDNCKGIGAQGKWKGTGEGQGWTCVTGKCQQSGGQYNNKYSCEFDGGLDKKQTAHFCTGSYSSASGDGKPQSNPIHTPPKYPARVYRCDPYAEKNSFCLPLPLSAPKNGKVQYPNPNELKSALFSPKPNLERTSSNKDAPGLWFEKNEYGCEYGSDFEENVDKHGNTVFKVPDWKPFQRNYPGGSGKYWGQCVPKAYQTCRNWCVNHIFPRSHKWDDAGQGVYICDKQAAHGCKKVEGGIDNLPKPTGANWPNDAEPAYVWIDTAGQDALCRNNTYMEIGADAYTFVCAAPGHKASHCNDFCACAFGQDCPYRR